MKKSIYASRKRISIIFVQFQATKMYQHHFFSLSYQQFSYSTFMLINASIVMIDSLVQIFWYYNQHMLLKFIKAEFRESRPIDNQVNVSLYVYQEESHHQIQIPRKIRNKVANFYGETLELLGKEVEFLITVQQIQPEKVDEYKESIVMEIGINTQLFAEKKSHWKNLVQENDKIKLYWAYCFPAVDNLKVSRKSSDLSMDLRQFEILIPTKEPTARENFKIYSPVHPRKKHKKWIFKQFDQQGEGYESSPEDKLQCHPPSKIIQKQELIQTMKLSFNFSKTNSSQRKTNKSDMKKFHQKQLKKISSSQSSNEIYWKYNDKGNESLHKKRENESPTRKKQKKHKKSIFELNTKHIAYACTFGVIAGLASCYLQQNSLNIV